MTFIRRGIRFAISLAEFLAAGSPKRDPEYVKHLFETHCEPCEHYDPDLKQCSICECFVSPNSDELNKLVWATEECPIKKWVKDVRISESPKNDAEK